MSSKVYGASDDLIEFEGEIHGEVSCYGTEDREQGVLLFFSDGTIIEAKYGKNDDALWGMSVRKKGSLFNKVDICEEETDKGHSDIVHFNDGKLFCYAASEWEKVK